MAAACSGGGVHLDESVSFVTDLETSIWEEARWGGGGGGAEDASRDLQLHMKFSSH